MTADAISPVSMTVEQARSILDIGADASRAEIDAARQRMLAFVEDRSDHPSTTRLIGVLRARIEGAARVASAAASHPADR